MSGVEILGAVSAGASLFQIALQGVKAVCEAVKAIKDGPETIREIERSCELLSTTLEALQATDVAVAAKPPELITSVQEANFKLSKFADKLKGLEVPQNGFKSIVSWNRVRYLFNERDIENMRNELTRLAVLLNLQLALSQG
jgi:hypothetical protein